MATTAEEVWRILGELVMGSRYADVQAIGAVAGMVVPDEVARYIYCKERLGTIDDGTVGK